MTFETLGGKGGQKERPGQEGTVGDVSRAALNDIDNAIREGGEVQEALFNRILAMPEEARGEFMKALYELGVRAEQLNEQVKGFDAASKKTAYYGSLGAGASVFTPAAIVAAPVAFLTFLAVWRIRSLHDKKVADVDRLNTFRTEFEAVLKSRTG